MKARKFLALALALALCLGLLPTTALAVSGSGSSSGGISYPVSGGSSAPANQEPIVLVLAAEWICPTTTSSEGELWAKLLFMDGTTQIVPVTKLNSLRVVTRNGSDPDSEIIGGPLEGAVRVSNGEPDQAITKLYETRTNAFYTYYQMDGKYELTQVVADTTGAVDGWSDTDHFSDARIEAKSDFSNGASSYSANTQTVFGGSKG